MAGIAIRHISNSHLFSRVFPQNYRAKRAANMRVQTLAALTNVRFIRTSHLNCREENGN